MKKNLVFGCFRFFGFHAKSGTTNNHWTRLADISYKSPFSRDSNDVKTFPNKITMRKTGLIFCVFRLNSTEESDDN